LTTERNRRGWLFAFEGLDGSGKSTQIQLLAEALRALGHEVVSTREPTDGKFGRRLRQLFANRDQCSPAEELRLFIEDRREHVTMVIDPALAAGKVVLTDRYYLSTAAYQGALGHDPEEILKENEAFAPLPDLVFFLQVPVSTGLGRIIRGRGDKPNDFEKEEGLQAVQEVFAEISRPFIRIIDGSRSIEEIREEVLSLALEKIGEQAGQSTGTAVGASILDASEGAFPNGAAEKPGDRK